MFDPERMVDGVRLGDVRDAAVAAFMIGDVLTATDILDRYNIGRQFCVRCGAVTGPQSHTYEVHGGRNYQVCLKCFNPRRR